MSPLLIVERAFDPAFRTKLPCKLRVAVEFLLTSMTLTVPLDELSSRVQLSKYHLSRLFVRFLGQPPHRFHTSLRVACAEKMLRGGRRAVEVAHELGFADQSHLNRHFKQHFGRPPAAYVRLVSTTATNGASYYPERSPGTAGSHATPSNVSSRSFGSMLRDMTPNLARTT